MEANTRAEGRRLAPCRVGGGAYVRTYGDGYAEVRTSEGGRLLRYVIEPEGAVHLVDIAPESQRYALRSLGFVLVLGCGFLIAAVMQLPRQRPPAGERWKRLAPSSSD